MTERIFRYLREQQPETPCLVVDLDVVENNFRRMRELLPTAHIFYAVKANPAAQILARLATAGSKFDTASRGEIELVQATGVAMDRISFGNTIKKEKDIAWAYQQGVRLFAFDSEAELQKLARVAPGARVFCRVLVDCGGAEWPLSKKFGCAPEMAKDLLRKAKEWGLDAYGISFHVGSQQTDLEQWDKALGQVSQMFFALAEEGVDLRMVNLGGGFPARYRAEVNSIEAYCEAVGRALVRHFGNRMPEVIIEPGRSMVGDAGVIQSEVVLVSRKSANDRKRWVYLDIGKFSGPGRDHGREHQVPAAHRPRRHARRPGGAGRPDLQLGRHPLREDRVQAAAVAQARRQGRDPVDRRLHDDLLVGRLQRLPAAQGDLHLAGFSTPQRNDGALRKAPSPFIDHSRKAGTLKWRRSSRAGSTSTSRAAW